MLVILFLESAAGSSKAQACVELRGWVRSYLRDTLAVLSSVEDGPGDAAGVLSLEEERLRLAVLESEDLAVATDVELTLQAGTVSLHHENCVAPQPQSIISSSTKPPI